MPLAVCATPIGNLEDVTLRVLSELAAADVVLCEDTRHTRVLLQRHGIEARLLSYHEHNEAKRTAELLPRLVQSQLVYIGLLGPKSRGDELFAETGLAADSRIHSPIGLDLGARTPEETAISIAAEIIAGRWGGSGQRLQSTEGRIHGHPAGPED